MPTGYKYGILEKNWTPYQYIQSISGIFGTDADLSSLRQSVEYYTEQLHEATENYNNWKSLRPESKEEVILSNIESERAYLIKEIEKRKQDYTKYLDIINALELWNVPYALAQVKITAIEQIYSTMDQDCNVMTLETELKGLNYTSALQEHERSLLWSIEYSSRELVKAKGELSKAEADREKLLKHMDELPGAPNNV